MAYRYSFFDEASFKLNFEALKHLFERPFLSLFDVLHYVSVTRLYSSQGQTQILAEKAAAKSTLNSAAGVLAISTEVEA